jgi:hypothetical protein
MLRILRITAILADFGLTNKVFPVTLDDAAANTRAINQLNPIYSVWLCW